MEWGSWEGVLLLVLAAGLVLLLWRINPAARVLAPALALLRARPSVLLLPGVLALVHVVVTDPGVPVPRAPLIWVARGVLDTIWSFHRAMPMGWEGGAVVGLAFLGTGWLGVWRWAQAGFGVRWRKLVLVLLVAGSALLVLRAVVDVGGMGGVIGLLVGVGSWVALGLALLVVQGAVVSAAADHVGGGPGKLLRREVWERTLGRLPSLMKAAPLYGGILFVAALVDMPDTWAGAVAGVFVLPLGLALASPMVVMLILGASGPLVAGAGGLYLFRDHLARVLWLLVMGALAHGLWQTLVTLVPWGAAGWDGMVWVAAAVYQVGLSLVAVLLLVAMTLLVLEVIADPGDAGE
jgi:hypothetical protein